MEVDRLNRNAPWVVRSCSPAERGLYATGCAVLMSEIATGLNIHQRSEYGKPCAVKAARTVWSRGKAQALPIATMARAQRELLR